jgi:hypothetical protein
MVTSERHKHEFENQLDLGSDRQMRCTYGPPRRWIWMDTMMFFRITNNEFHTSNHWLNTRITASSSPFKATNQGCSSGTSKFTCDELGCFVCLEAEKKQSSQLEEHDSRPRSSLPWVVG